MGCWTCVKSFLELTNNENLATVWMNWCKHFLPQAAKNCRAYDLVHNILVISATLQRNYNVLTNQLPWSVKLTTNSTKLDVKYRADMRIRQRINKKWCGILWAFSSFLGGSMYINIDWNFSLRLTEQNG